MPARNHMCVCALISEFVSAYECAYMHVRVHLFALVHVCDIVSKQHYVREFIPACMQARLCE